MSDLESDSRTSAVGRKRNKQGKPSLFPRPADSADDCTGSGSKDKKGKEELSRRSSLESGEISSQGEERPPSTDHLNRYGQSFIEGNSRIAKKRRLSASSVSSALDGSEKLSKGGCAAESSEAEGAAPEPHAMRSNTEGTRLCELSYQEVVQQELYFALDLDKYPDDLCYCLCCGARGHMESVCSEATCKHCKAKKAHASYACPIYRKCRLCRQRGHDPHECTNPARSLDSDLCDICHQSGHVEEQCPRLWSTSLHPDPTEKVRKIHERKMTKACYSCGSNGHWGDDCQYRDRYAPPSLVKTWSKAFADQFVIEHDSRVETVAEAEEAPQASSAFKWQLSMLGDERD